MSRGDEVVICRCEEVTRQRIREAIREGGLDIDKIKRQTRAGMGLCQGRTCRRLVLQILSEETGVPVSELDTGTYRAPLRPLEMGILVSGKDRDLPPESGKSEQVSRSGKGERRMEDSCMPKFMTINNRGHLQVEDCDVVDLADEFGTPLYVTSENQIRYNYRRFRDAFASRYPNVDIYYALKANNNLAVRRILFSEGAGGECFGMSEMYATYLGGAKRGRVVINGSNKSKDELRQAVIAGARIQIDAEDEVAALINIGKQLKVEIPVRLRIKPEIQELMSEPAESNPKITVAQRLLEGKWGLDLDTCIELTRRIRASACLKLEGLNLHFSRAGTSRLDHFAIMVANVVGFAAEIRRQTGYTAGTINFGGGFAHGFNVEGHNKPYPPIEDYAETMVTTLRDVTTRLGFPPPVMEFEPGRYLVGNSTVLVGRVGAVKVLPGRRTWVHVDASTNNLIKAVSAGYVYKFISANRANEAPAGPVDVVGPLCSDDVMGKQVPLPLVARGDLVAAFDAGHYAETGSCQFNGIPRPATVLVCGHEAEVIRVRETINDVFGKNRIPVRLLGSP